MHLIQQILDITYHILDTYHQIFYLMLLGQWVDPFETECIIEQKKITSIEMQVGMQMSTFIGNLQGTQQLMSSRSGPFRSISTQQ